MPVGMLGMYFFLASEAMFFLGLLGSFVVLESAGGQRDLFAQSAGTLSRSAASMSVAMLLVSTAVIKRQPLIAFVVGIVFVLWQWAQWHHLLAMGSGPSRNNFFACYFLFTAVHTVHLIGGLIALFGVICKATPVSQVLRRAGLVAARATTSGAINVPRPLQIYWHFVNILGVAGLAVLYFP